MRILTIIALLIIVFRSYSQNAYYETLILNNINKINTSGVIDSSLFDSDKDVISYAKWSKFYHTPFDTALHLTDFDIDFLNRFAKKEPVVSSIVSHQNYSVLPNGKDENQQLIDWLQKPEEELEKLKGLQFNLFDGAVSGGSFERPGQVTKGGHSIISNVLDVGVIYLENQFRSTMVREFFHGLNNHFKKDTLLTSLFPKSRNQLDLLEKENIPAIQSHLKKDFHDDYQNMSHNLMKYLDEHLPDSTKQKHHFRLKKMIFDGIELLHQGYAPPETFQKLTEQYNIPEENADLAINVLYVFSKNTISNLNTELYINNNEWSKVNNLPQLSVFNGLLYQEMKEKPFFKHHLKEFLYEYESKHRELHDTYKLLLDKLNELDHHWMRMSGDNHPVSDYITAYTECILLAYDLLVLSKTPEEAKNTKDDYYPVFQLIDLYEAKINNDNFTMFNSAINIVEFYEGDYIHKHKGLKFALLSSEITLAKNSEDIEKITENHLQTNATYSNKRTSKTAVSINSYIGLNTGVEHLLGGDNAPYFGLTAAMGISLSKGKLSAKKGKYSSNELFVSLLDFGPFLSIRLQDTTGVNANNHVLLPQIKLQQVFSPGLYYAHGFANSPFSLLFGTHFSPLLREVNGKELHAIRFIVGLSLDFPVFFVKKKVFD